MLEKQVGELLRARGETLAVAESCTGGKVGDMITNVPGSSDYFLGGVISYSNDAKVRVLGVKESTIKAKGAVSEEVALQMAAGARKKLRSTYGIGITGIAGPNSGTSAKPVGLVYIAVSSAEDSLVERVVFKGTRTEVKLQAANFSLKLLQDFMEKHS